MRRAPSRSCCARSGALLELGRFRLRAGGRQRLCVAEPGARGAAAAGLGRQGAACELQAARRRTRCGRGGEGAARCALFSHAPVAVVRQRRSHAAAVHKDAASSAGRGRAIAAGSTPAGGRSRAAAVAGAAAASQPPAAAARTPGAGGAAPPPGGNAKGSAGFPTGAPSLAALDDTRPKKLRNEVNLRQYCDLLVFMLFVVRIAALSAYCLLPKRPHHVRRS